jgi:hypothetical protein
MDPNLIYLKPIAKEVAKNIIIKNHYTHAWTICELALGIFHKSHINDNAFFDQDMPLGTIVYGPTAGANVAKSISPLLNHENLWELKRLWLDDLLGKNSESVTISRSFTYIRKNHPEIQCLVSYADPDAGHVGGIYAATNWRYEDIERPKNTSGYAISFDNGKTWVHPRTLFNKYGTFNKDKLIPLLPRPFLLKELSTKHRYIMPLGSKSWKRQLEASFVYPSRTYPKNARNSETITSYDV